MEQDWLPVREAARRLGVSEATIKRRIRAGAVETRQEQVAKGWRYLVPVPRLPDTAAPAVGRIVADLHAEIARLTEAVEGLRSDLHAALMQGQMISRPALPPAPPPDLVQSGPDDLSRPAVPDDPPTKRAGWRRWLRWG